MGEATLASCCRLQQWKVPLQVCLESSSALCQGPHVALNNRHVFFDAVHGGGAASAWSGAPLSCNSAANWRWLPVMLTSVSSQCVRSKSETRVVLTTTCVDKC